MSLSAGKNMSRQAVRTAATAARAVMSSLLWTRASTPSRISAMCANTPHSTAKTARKSAWPAKAVRTLRSKYLRARSSGRQIRARSLRICPETPKYAQPGQPSRSLELLLELKMIADVGLVGFPNVGKSTLLSMSSNAKPRIANYHFTTLQPILGVVDLEDAKGFVMADIPGLIEGAADGAGLGHEFLAHLERTRILIHVVDAAGSEGRDPIEDIMAINRELARYKIDLSSRRQIIAANKCDLIPGEEYMEEGDRNPIDEIRAYCEPLGYEVFPISAATGEGVKELLYHCSSVLAQMPSELITYEQEYDPEVELAEESEPYTVTYDAKTKEYLVEGPRIERMLGYTNLETEKGFVFFQKFMVDNGIIDELKRLGCKEGDTVRLYGHGFEFFD